MRGLTPKNTVAEYEHTGKAGQIEIGATYMGRSFADPEGKLHDAGEFLVIEVGVFVEKKFDGVIRAGDFQLRLEDKKVTLLTTPPGLVANTLRNRDMDPQRRRLVMAGGMGNGQVVMGAPRPQQRFPGDPRPGQTRPAGASSTTEGEGRDWDAAVESGLVEVVGGSARAGNLYFAYGGKMTKVKKIVLDYEGDAGKVSLKLR